MMSSSSNNARGLQFFRILPVVFTLLLAFAIVFSINQEADGAKRAKTAAKAKKKLPLITKVTPIKGAAINSVLTVEGKNFVKGKNKMVFVFQRFGSKRRYAIRATGVNTKKATVRVPNVAGDMIPEQEGRTMLPTDNMFRLRAITKYGASKKLTNNTLSPVIAWAKVLIDDETRGPEGDCDLDNIKNKNDPDDDNDRLPDSVELTIATDVCETDTDLDGMNDYWEYRVGYQYNGGDYPTLPYPALQVFPNPLVGDQNFDFDGDGLTAIREYQAWQHTGSLDRFYSDADQDSFGPLSDTNDPAGLSDAEEDEDGDRLPNAVELFAFQGGVSAQRLNYLKWDSDGDGLCDGLDDQDRDGPVTPIASADCASPVPNNGQSGTPWTETGTGDPNGLIDADDNIYSNFYEWMIQGANPILATWAFNPCVPSQYPTSPYCPGVFDPF